MKSWALALASVWIGCACVQAVPINSNLVALTHRPFRPISTPFLHLPEKEDAPMPRLLSETGAFQDVRKLVPNSSLIPYDLNVPFWSDGASKARWIAVPHQNHGRPQRIGFKARDEWTFPNGTVFVKHFEFNTNRAGTSATRRLETRLLVRDSTGGVYGVTYKWRPDQTDAELLTTNVIESFLVRTAAGVRTQSWYYPSPADCRTCHTANSGGVLGVKTRQLNREYRYPSRDTMENQLRAWNDLGLFQPALQENQLETLDKLVPADDPKGSLEQRARSYLDVNCAQCHRPGGVVSYFDARYDVPLEKQNLVNGPVVIDQGIDNARAVAPNDPWRSLVLLRVNTLEPTKMPPLAHEVIDEKGVELLQKWIRSLPGPAVMAPPDILPKGGEFHGTLMVRLKHDDPNAELRFTLDGSAPGKQSQLYLKPVELTAPATLRARAFKPGFTRSVTVQETFIVE